MRDIDEESSMFEDLDDSFSESSSCSSGQDLAEIVNECCSDSEKHSVGECDDVMEPVVLTHKERK